MAVIALVMTSPHVADRQSAREQTDLRIPVWIISHGADGDLSGTGICTGLSEDGVTFESAAALDMNDSIELVFGANRRLAVGRKQVRLLCRLRQKYVGYFQPAA
jgi:hypothetical protein